MKHSTSGAGASGRATTVKRPAAARPARQEGLDAAAPVDEEVVRRMAYSIYEERGCTNGHDLEDWLEAEARCVGRAKKH